ncbi:MULTISPECIES: methylated-DNA--[protein]-cysteine S-methyltransferase [unclassified Psychrobacter]|uniref:methylated-DNA--[protein]-cysteine S-methyltransferase n=1 Tax=unclassified Psychrobacter TaxID=196806 RepID=UPI0025B2FF54|nr:MULTISPECIES: methylated-DNA--[protein]-cysteine S-methyltransferase [unclassified Psychrobacter]MDN3454160.1 methylated-DNA--[protein]-cysteine S-methyltransferase [Psychrobacter sp. APC 3350]MDN3503071.1 methylated-DNA--[protein]-cysteine S-methyltransferase [Psychrobacter sp. 5A.1]
MIVTTAAFGLHRLTLIARVNEHGQPMLVEANWLLAGNSWHNSKSVPKLKKHYGLIDEDFTFIDKNSLSISDRTQALLLTAIEQINEYISGERKDFDLPLDMSLGTEFQQRVWRGLQTIPHGETISYATLAKRVDNPKGFRAVAQANGKNPFSIIVPCHRVIASDGKLGGYTGGLDKKEYLLALEGVKCKP